MPEQIKSPYSVSFVVPALNEEKVVDHVVREIHSHVDNLVQTNEIILIVFSRWWEPWGYMFAGLDRDLQNATTLHATEMVTTFWGCDMNITGVHVENYATPTTLIRLDCNFCGNRPNRLTGVYLNYDPSLGQIESTAGPQFYAQQTFPFMVVGNADLFVDGFTPSRGGGVFVIVVHFSAGTASRWH